MGDLRCGGRRCGVFRARSMPLLALVKLLKVLDQHPELLDEVKVA
jgi:hypothetical protein